MREVETISGGLLKGKHWIRFMRTTFPECLTGEHELAVQNALAMHIRPGTIFYDIGANSGFFSLLGSLLVGPGGRVVSFEPHPVTAQQLEAQMRVNNVTNVDVVCAAVCDQVGTSRFADDVSSDMLSLVGANEPRKTITVSTTTLNNEIKTHGIPSVLKIDVEGAEVAVLRGGKDFLQANRPILLVEIHSPEIAAQYDELMDAIGYRTLDLEGNSVSAKNGSRFVISKLAID